MAQKVFSISESFEDSIPLENSSHTVVFVLSYFCSSSLCDIEDFSV